MNMLRIRIWDGKEMHYGSFQIWFDRDGDIKVIYPLEYCANPVVMHWTGMEDKNGRKIYDGDIVRVIGPYDAQQAQVTWGQLQPLSWSNCTETWTVRFADRVEGHLRKRVEGPLYAYCQREWGFDVEIVGNIYENADFLTEHNTPTSLP